MERSEIRDLRPRIALRFMRATGAWFVARMERSEIRDQPIRSPKPWLVARHAEGMAQGGDAVDENGGTSIGDGDREEERPTGNEASPIAHPARSLPRITLRSIRATGLPPFPDNV